MICTLNADVYGFNELENTTASATITDLLGAINTRCGGAHPYTFANTGGTLGTDAIRVQQIYRTGVLSPVGSPLVDLDPVHNRPPTAQTYDVVDAANPAFGQRFTVIANHFKSKGCPGTGADADAGDGQSCFNGTRVAQANRLLAWVTGTVLPAAGDPDVLLLGDFNSNAKEDPVTAILGGGYTDLETFFQGANAYSYLFDGQIGHLDYAFASASLLLADHRRRRLAHQRRRKSALRLQRRDQGRRRIGLRRKAGRLRPGAAAGGLPAGLALARLRPRPGAGRHLPQRRPRDHQNRQPLIRWPPAPTSPTPSR